MAGTGHHLNEWQAVLDWRVRLVSSSVTVAALQRVVNESRRPALRLRRAAPQDAAALAAQQAASRGQAVHDAAGLAATDCPFTKWGLSCGEP